MSITIHTLGAPEPAELDRRLSDARGWAYAMRNQLMGEISNIVMSGQNNNARNKLLHAIEDYIRAEARVTMLEILNSEDFFQAMARSAAKVAER